MKPIPTNVIRLRPHEPYDKVNTVGLIDANGFAFHVYEDHYDPSTPICNLRDFIRDFSRLIGLSSSNCSLRAIVLDEQLNLAFTQASYAHLRDQIDPVYPEEYDPIQDGRTLEFARGEKRHFDTLAREITSLHGTQNTIVVTAGTAAIAPKVEFGPSLSQYAESDKAALADLKALVRFMKPTGWKVAAIGIASPIRRSYLNIKPSQMSVRPAAGVRSAREKLAAIMELKADLARFLDASPTLLPSLK